MKDNLVWYAAYGSNLLEERFMTYIKGGNSRFNGRSYPGCRDKSDPIRTEAYVIEYPIYFGNQSSSWDGGGVAFLDDHCRPDKVTLGRIYLITEEQFEDIQSQEGNSKRWYGKRVYLGEVDGYPVWTFTSEMRNDSNKPSNDYLNVIKAGILETYPELDEEAIESYIGKIMFQFKIEELIKKGKLRRAEL